MNQLSIINTNFRTIASYLQDNTYFVPDYQREYSWEQDQVDDFWQDLEGLLQSQETSMQHFFGQIVIHAPKDEDGKKYIIDGQQRTTTAVVFLSVLKDIFNSIYHEGSHEGARNKVEDIRLKYIGRYSDEENELKLHLGKSDLQYFREYIQNGKIQNSSKPKIKSHLRIYNAYNYLKDKVFESCNLETEKDLVQKYKDVLNVYDTFIKKFNVLYVETDDINEAFIIFETLNARGKDLETSDLLKNHLFRQSASKIERVKDLWQKMSDTLENNDTTKFIRSYWNSRNQFIREKNLYKKIRETIKYPRDAELVVENLERVSPVYVALISPNTDTYFLDAELNLMLKNLKTLSASSFYPIVLAMFSNDYEEVEIKSVLKAVETLVVRNFVIAGRVANRYETTFSTIALEISGEKITTADEIVKLVQKETISDEEFYTAFTSVTVKKKAVIRYLFKKMNQYYDQETTILNDNGRIHIEHIMPVKAEHWEVDEEDKEEYLWRLGNLTLLGKEYNQKITNHTFDIKKAMYSESNIKITNLLIQYNDWTTEAIRDRQKKLASVALETWKV